MDTLPVNQCLDNSTQNTKGPWPISKPCILHNIGSATVHCLLSTDQESPHVVTLAQHCSRHRVKTVSYHTVTMICSELICEQPRSLHISYQGRGKKACHCCSCTIATQATLTWTCSKPSIDRFHASKWTSHSLCILLLNHCPSPPVMQKHG